jgi:hypothetical protein
MKMAIKPAVNHQPVCGRAAGVDAVSDGAVAVLIVPPDGRRPAVAAEGNGGADGERGMAATVSVGQSWTGCGSRLLRQKPIHDVFESDKPTPLSVGRPRVTEFRHDSKRRWPK